MRSAGDIRKREVNSGLGDGGLVAGANRFFLIRAQAMHAGCAGTTLLRDRNLNLNNPPETASRVDVELG